MSARPTAPSAATPLASVVARFLVVAATAGALAAGCSSSRFTRPLPAYTGPTATLFDDSVEPSAIGLDFDQSYDAMKDRTFRERLHAADGVLRVRIATVSSKTGSEDDPSFTFHVQPLETLHGQFPPDGPFDVAISPRSSTLGVFKHLEHKLVGGTFIAFTKDYRPPGGTAETHVHLAPDTPAVKKAVADLIALDSL